MKKVDGNVFNRATLFTLSLSSWGNRRKANTNMIEVDADKKRLSISKRLIDSPEYDAVCRHQWELKQWCMARCMPSFFKDGIYLVALTEVQTFEEKLAHELRHMQNVLVPAFLEAYETRIEESRNILREMFNEADYPSVSELRQKFDIQWNWIQFTIPENLPEGIREAEIEKLQRKFQEAQEEIVTALRTSFGELVKHAVDRLSPKPDGKQPIFRDSLIENFNEFFQTFKSRNLMEDEELKAVVEQAQKLLANVDGKALRDTTSIRNTIASNFVAIQKQVDKLIVDRPNRRFSEE